MCHRGRTSTAGEWRVAVVGPVSASASAAASAAAAAPAATAAAAASAPRAGGDDAAVGDAASAREAARFLGYVKAEWDAEVVALEEAEAEAAAAAVAAKAAAALNWQREACGLAEFVGHADGVDGNPAVGLWEEGMRGLGPGPCRCEKKGCLRAAGPAATDLPRLN